MKRAGRGLTLPELMVGMTILVIILGICTMIFMSSWQKFHATNSLSDAQRNAVLGIDRFCRDFRDTSPSYIDNQTSLSDRQSRYICFPSPRGIDGKYLNNSDIYSAGEPICQKWVLYYLVRDDQHSSNRISSYLLYRKEAPGNLGLPGLMKAQVMAEPSTYARIVARNIYDFTVSQSCASTGLAALTSFDVKVEALGFYREEIHTYSLNRAVSLESFLHPAPPTGH
jgi:prepilin-type N-terminal cleavage/methylation domain-containing protein